MEKEKDKMQKAINLINEYIKLYEEDKPYIKNDLEKCLNSRTIEEFKHIKRILEN